MSGLVYKPEYDKGSQAREVQNAFDKKIQSSREGQAGLQKLGLDIATSRYMAAAKAKQDIYGAELGNMSDANREDIGKLRDQIRERHNNGDFARNPFLYGTMLKGLNDHIARSSKLHTDAVSGDGENTYNSQMQLLNRGEFNDYYDKKGYDVISDDPAQEQAENYNKYNSNAFYSNTRFDENGVLVAEQKNPETGEVVGTKDVASMPLWEMGSNLFQPGLKVLSPASLYDVGGSQEVQTRLTQIEKGLRNNVGSVMYAENFGEEPQSIEVAMMTPDQKQNYISDTYFDDMVSSPVHKDTTAARSFRRSLANEMGLDAQTPEYNLFVEGRYDELSSTALGKDMMSNARGKWREVTRMLPAASVNTKTNRGVAGDSRTMVLGGLQDPSNPEQIEDALNIQAGVLPFGNMTGYSFVNNKNEPDPIEFEGSVFDGGEYNVSAVFYEVDESAYVEGSNEIPGRLMARVVIPEREVVEYEYVDGEGNSQFTEDEQEARNKSEGPYEGKTRTKKVESSVKLVPLDEGIGTQGEEIMNRVKFGTDPNVFEAQMNRLKQENTRKFWEARAAQDQAIADKERMSAVERFNAAIPMDQQSAIIQEMEDIQRRMTAYRPASPDRTVKNPDGGFEVIRGNEESDNLEALQQRLNELKTSEFVSQDANGNNVYTPVSKLISDRKEQDKRNKDRVEAGKVAWRTSPLGGIITGISDEPGSTFNAMNDEQGTALVRRIEKGGTVKIKPEALNWAMSNMPEVGRAIRNALKNNPQLSGAFNVKPDTYAAIAEKEIYKALEGLSSRVNKAYEASNKSAPPAQEEPDDDGLTFPDTQDQEPQDPFKAMEGLAKESNEAIMALPEDQRSQVNAKISELRSKKFNKGGVFAKVETNAAGDAKLVTFVDEGGFPIDGADTMIFDI